MSVTHFLAVFWNHLSKEPVGFEQPSKTSLRPDQILPTLLDTFLAGDMNDTDGTHRVQNTVAEDSDDEHENMRSPLLGARRGREPLPSVSNWDFMSAILLEVSCSCCRFPRLCRYF